MAKNQPTIDAFMDRRWSSEYSFLSKLYNKLLHRPTNDVRTEFILLGSVGSNVLFAVLIYARIYDRYLKNPNSGLFAGLHSIAIVIEVAKFFISILLHVTFDHYPASKTTKSSQWFNRFNVFLKYLAVSLPTMFILCYNNRFSVSLLSLNAAGNSMSSFASHFHVLVTTLAWCLIFQKKISARKWDGLVLVTVGGSMKYIFQSWDNSGHLKNYNLPKGGDLNLDLNIYTCNVLSQFVQLMCLSLACVCHERLLKRYNKIAQINLQQTLKSAANIISIFLIEIRDGSFNRLDVNHMYNVNVAEYQLDNSSNTPPMKNAVDAVGAVGAMGAVGGAGISSADLPLVLVGVISGISTGYVLFYFNSIQKSIVTSIQILLSPVAIMFAFGTHMQFLGTILGLSLIARGYKLFHYEPKEQKHPFFTLPSDMDPSTSRAPSTSGKVKQTFRKMSSKCCCRKLQNPILSLLLVLFTITSWAPLYNQPSKNQILFSINHADEASIKHPWMQDNHRVAFSNDFHNRTITGYDRAKILNTILQKTINKFNMMTNNSVRLILDSGSLLGYIRNKRNLPWDDDIDVSFWEKDLLLFERNPNIYKGKPMRLALKF
jgi:hypothetical protein